MEDLNLQSLTVIYPGNESFPLAKKITAMGLEQFAASSRRPGKAA